MKFNLTVTTDDGSPIVDFKGFSILGLEDYLLSLKRSKEWIQQDLKEIREASKLF